MLSSIQKDEIIGLITEEKTNLGSYRAVAKKCGVSEAAISQLRDGKYAGETDAILQRIGEALNYEFDNGSWQIADTTNHRIVTTVLADAKAESMFIGISHCAGSGKTCGKKVFYEKNRTKGVFAITARDWSGRQFLLHVAHTIGAEIPKGYARVDQLYTAIGKTIKGMANIKPQIIVDQANSLKPSALRTFIHLFNECEDILSVVILGTDNLETEIKRGVRLNRTGYDEFDSRFGREYIRLAGNTLADCRKICDINGITDRETQKEIFDRCRPERTSLNDGRTILVVQDTRLIKNLIKRKRLSNRYAN